VHDIGKVDIFGIDLLKSKLAYLDVLRILTTPLPWSITNPISQQICHEPAAQLLAKANNPVLGPSIDFEVEALGGDNVVDELLAVVLDIGRDLLLQLWVLDKGLNGENVVVADFLDQGSGLVQNLGLGRIVASGGRNGPQVFVDAEKSVG
jgi:hypothetical protein